MQSTSLHHTVGSGNLAVSNTSHCTINYVHLKPGATGKPQTLPTSVNFVLEDLGTFCNTKTNVHRLTYTV